ncbi:MAG TPA: GspMb/PilO family protein [Aquabacterium sp.]|nr:GspMb/PilO family protein [Aquabacterium sp.]
MMPRSLLTLGLPGLIGVALLVGAVWVERQWLPQQQEALDTLESSARRVRRQLQDAVAQAQPASDAQAAAGPNAAPVAPRQAWTTLWLGLPEARTRTALQRDVLVSAQAAGLQAPSVQVRGAAETWLPKEANERLWRQRLTMPVEGAYPALLGWLKQLSRQPGLTIDALDIQRADVLSDRVKAQVSVSLWWRVPGGPR